MKNKDIIKNNDNIAKINKEKSIVNSEQVEESQKKAVNTTSATEKVIQNVDEDLQKPIFRDYAGRIKYGSQHSSNDVSDVTPTSETYQTQTVSDCINTDDIDNSGIVKNKDVDGSFKHTEVDTQSSIKGEKNRVTVESVAKNYYREQMTNVVHSESKTTSANTYQSTTHQEIIGRDIPEYTRESEYVVQPKFVSETAKTDNNLQQPNTPELSVFTQSKIINEQTNVSSVLKSKSDVVISDTPSFIKSENNDFTHSVANTDISLKKDIIKGGTRFKRFDTNINTNIKSDNFKSNTNYSGSKSPYAVLTNRKNVFFDNQSPITDYSNITSNTNIVIHQSANRITDKFDKQASVTEKKHFSENIRVYQYKDNMTPSSIIENKKLVFIPNQTQIDIISNNQRDMMSATSVDVIKQVYTHSKTGKSKLSETAYKNTVKSYTDSIKSELQQHYIPTQNTPENSVINEPQVNSIVEDEQSVFQSTAENQVLTDTNIPQTSNQSEYSQSVRMSQLKNTSKNLMKEQQFVSKQVTSVVNENHNQNVVKENTTVTVNTNAVQTATDIRISDSVEREKLAQAVQQKTQHNDSIKEIPKDAFSYFTDDEKIKSVVKPVSTGIITDEDTNNDTVIDNKKSFDFLKRKSLQLAHKEKTQQENGTETFYYKSNKPVINAETNLSTVIHEQTDNKDYVKEEKDAFSYTDTSSVIKDQVSFVETTSTAHNTKSKKRKKLQKAKHTKKYKSSKKIKTNKYVDSRKNNRQETINNTDNNGKYALKFGTSVIADNVEKQLKNSDDVGSETTAVATDVAISTVEVLMPEKANKEKTKSKITKGDRRKRTYNKTQTAQKVAKLGIKDSVHIELDKIVSQTNSSMKKAFKKGGNAITKSIKTSVEKYGEDDMSIKAVDNVIKTVDTAVSIKNGIIAAKDTQKAFVSVGKSIKNSPKKIKNGINKVKSSAKKLQRIRRMKKAHKIKLAKKTAKNVAKKITDAVIASAKGLAAKVIAIVIVIFLLLVIVLFMVILVISSFMWNTSCDMDTTKIVQYISTLDYNQQLNWYNKGKTNIEIEKENDRSRIGKYYKYILFVDTPPDIYPEDGVVTDESNINCLIKIGFDNSNNYIRPSYPSTPYTYYSKDAMLENYRWTTDDYRAALAYLQVKKDNLGWLSSMFGFVGEYQLRSAAKELHKQTYEQYYVVKTVNKDDVSYSYQTGIFQTSYSPSDGRYTDYYYFGKKYSVKYLIENDIVRFDDDDEKNKADKEMFENIYIYGNLGVANLSFPLELDADETISDRIAKHFGKQVVITYEPPDEPDGDSDRDVYGSIKKSIGFHYANDLSADEGDNIYAPITGLCKVSQTGSRGYEYTISTAYTGNEFDYTKNGYLIKISCASSTEIPVSEVKVVNKGDKLGTVGKNMTINYLDPEDSLFSGNLFPCCTGTNYSSLGANDFDIPNSEPYIHIEMYKLPCDFSDPNDIEKNILAPELFFDYSDEVN